VKTQTKPSTLQNYLNLNYPITLYPEPDGGYTVMLIDLPECLTQGDTLEEAIADYQPGSPLLVFKTH
jgi:hypothetical protein